MRVKTALFYFFTVTFLVGFFGAGKAYEKTGEKYFPIYALSIGAAFCGAWHCKPN